MQPHLLGYRKTKVVAVTASVPTTLMSVIYSFIIICRSLPRLSQFASLLRLAKFLCRLESFGSKKGRMRSLKIADDYDHDSQADVWKHLESC